MKQFLTLDDLPDLDRAINEGIALKKEPYKWEALGKQKTLGMLFFNPSLRTRLSTQKAAQQLGIKTMIMNFSNEAWALEYEDGTQMSGLRSEHIREAAAVISQYCDVVAIRAFASLNRQRKRRARTCLEQFYKIRHHSCYQYGKCHRPSFASFGGRHYPKRTPTKQAT